MRDSIRDIRAIITARAIENSGSSKFEILIIKKTVNKAIYSS
jgi:hypothetical protein